MRRTNLQLVAILAAVLGSHGCAVFDDGSAATGEDGDSLARSRQAVFVEPVFILEGLEQVPRGLLLEQLHLGVGALFLDLVDEDDSGVVFANRDPFQLHFDIASGAKVARGPLMTLPHGGTYQISVQLEPQLLLVESEVASAVGAADDSAEASLAASGVVVETEYPAPNDDGTDEAPVPLPWYPDDFGQLRASLSAIPFTYTSDRTVRFSLEHVDLANGTSNELVMRLQVGDWIRETIRPALDDALDQRSLTDEEIDSEDIDLDDLVDQLGDGMDGLIGGIDVEVDQN